VNEDRRRRPPAIVSAVVHHEHMTDREQLPPGAEAAHRARI
jgi:hypothetical protein